MMFRVAVKLSAIMVLLGAGLSGLSLAMSDRFQAHELAFVSERDGNIEIYVAHIERGLLVNATQHPTLDNQPQWSPDAAWLLFNSGRGQAFSTYIVNTRSWQVMAIGDVGNAYSPVWSPDSARIAFRENNPQATGENPFQFRIFNLETGAIQITQDIEGWEFGGASIITEFGILSDDPNLRRIIVRDIHGFPRFADIRPEDIRQSGLIEAGNFSSSTIDLSNNGQFFASAEDMNGQTDIYLIPVTEGDAINLTDHPSPDTDPVWSDDGAYVAFVSQRDGNSEVYVVNIATRRVINVSQHQRRDYTPVWSP